MPLAVLTNPYHTDGVAADVHTALEMPLADRVARHEMLRATVWQDTASAWAQTFLADLRG
jgi:trehalose 6-phosphate synthase